MNQYAVGTLVRLTASISVASTPINPTMIKMRVINPDQTITDLSSGIVNDSAGNFHVDLVPASIGLYQYQWVCTGNVQVTNTDQFLVNQGEF